MSALSSLALAHDLSVDAHTGQMSLTVPLELPAGRQGLTPGLALGYGSGAANSVFGRGWQLSGVPSITISTERALPSYDGDESFAMAGAGELVPYLAAPGERAADGGWEVRDGYRVRRYRPRLEGAFLRIERFVEIGTGRTHWRVRDGQNRLTIFGARPDGSSQIRDPARPARTFAWLAERQIDSNGNAICFDHVAEDLRGVDRAAAYERSRLDTGEAPAQRYLKRVRWGNVVPVAADLEEPADQRWCFELVLDYGDHDPNTLAPEPDRPWGARPDPFSSYATGIELRTHRLCRRLLVFHRFDALGPAPVAVQTTALHHDQRPDGTTLARIVRTGHRQTPAGIVSQERPALVFTYAAATVGEAFAPLATSWDLADGLESRNQRLIDLRGDGLPGLLIETPDAWFYRDNEGGGRFGRARLILDRPAHRIAEMAVQDVDGDSVPDLAVFDGRAGGFYAFEPGRDRWSGFRPFAAMPHVATRSDARWLDLNGDGRADLVMGGPDRVTCFRSRGREGFDPGITVTPGGGAMRAPWRDQPTRDYLFADMTGDGLLDQVLIRNGLLVYWPNMGHGRFGEAVVMDDAPRFAADGAFDAKRVILADLDGGGADVLYLAEGEIRIWANASGNRLLPARTIRGLPVIDNQASISVTDLLGDGTPCLVWTSRSAAASAPIQYLPLSGPTRPGLLVAVANGMGAEQRVFYGSAAMHGLRDRRAGRAWRTRISGNATVVDRLEQVDRIGGGRLATEWRYHDGSHNRRDRRGRGFGFEIVSRLRLPITTRTARRLEPFMQSCRTNFCLRLQEKPRPSLSLKGRTPINIIWR